MKSAVVSLLVVLSFLITLLAKPMSEQETLDFFERLYKIPARYSQNSCGEKKVAKIAINGYVRESSNVGFGAEEATAALKELKDRLPLFADLKGNGDGKTDEQELANLRKFFGFRILLEIIALVDLGEDVLKLIKPPNCNPNHSPNLESPTAVRDSLFLIISSSLPLFQKSV